MENSQTLATESFSYSWLLNIKPSIDGLIEPHRPSFCTDEDIEFLAYSKRFLEEAQNFNFDVKYPVFESVHADEIFCDGHIMPLYLDKSKIEAFEQALNKFNTSSISSTTPPTPISSRASQADFLEKWRKFSGRILVKWLGFLKPFSRKLGSSRKSAKVDDLQRKEREIIQRCKSTNSSSQGSPRRMMKSYSVVDWGENGNNQRSSSTIKTLRKVKSWNNSSHHEASSPIIISPSSHSTDVWRDMESAISDAILHCKRSFGTPTA